MNIATIKNELVESLAANAALAGITDANDFAQKYETDAPDAFAVHPFDYRAQVGSHLPHLARLGRYSGKTTALEIGGVGYTACVCNRLGYDARVLDCGVAPSGNDEQAALATLRSALDVQSESSRLESWDDLKEIGERGYELICINVDALPADWSRAEWEYFLSALIRGLPPSGAVYLFREIRHKKPVWNDDETRNFLLGLGPQMNASGSKMIFANTARLRIGLPLAVRSPRREFGFSETAFALVKNAPIGNSSEDARQLKLGTAQELVDWLDSVPADKFVVGMYIGSYTLAQDEWMNPLAVHLKAAGYITVGLLTEESNKHCTLCNTDCVAVIKPQDLKKLGRINVFVILDVDETCHFPQESKVLGFIHGFTQVGFDFSVTYHTHTPIYLDAFACSFPLTPKTRELTQALWNGMTNCNAGQRKSEDFYLIPVGYPRAAALSEGLAKAPCKPDAIIYAPVFMAYCPEFGGNRIEESGEKIISALLEAFPDHKIIFRPDPSDLELPQIKAIAAKFSDNPRFILDNRKERVSSFSRGAALVTDLSHIMGSFAYTTMRPAYFFQPWETSKSGFLAVPGGGYAYDLKTLIQRIKADLSDIERVSTRIRQDRDRSCMPVENAFSEIASFLPDLYHGRPRDTWLKIKRNGDGRLSGQVVLIERILGEAKITWYQLAWKAFLSFNPQSPLLAAFAIHMGKAHNPARLAGVAVYENIGKILGKQLARTGMREIDPEDVRWLYNQARRACEADFNMAGLTLVDRLCAEYEILEKGA